MWFQNLVSFHFQSHTNAMMPNFACYRRDFLYLQFFSVQLNFLCKTCPSYCLLDRCRYRFDFKIHPIYFRLFKDIAKYLEQIFSLALAWFMLVAVLTLFMTVQVGSEFLLAINFHLMTFNELSSLSDIIWHCFCHKNSFSRIQCDDIIFLFLHCCSKFDRYGKLSGIVFSKFLFETKKNAGGALTPSTLFRKIPSYPIFLNLYVPYVRCVLQECWYSCP